MVFRSGQQEDALSVTGVSGRRSHREAVLKDLEESLITAEAARDVYRLDV